MIPESGMNKNISSSIIKSKYNAFKNSKAIICISKFTQNQLISYYPEFKDKTHIIHLGLSDKWDIKIKSDYPTPKCFDNYKDFRYLSYIGNRYEYKNAQILMKAINNIKDIKIIFIRW